MGMDIEFWFVDCSFWLEEFLVFVLCFLWEDVEVFFGEFVSEVIVIVFVYFSEVQCQVMRVVGEFVGFEVEYLFNEFIVVVFVYGLYYVDVESKFFVFDFGGGIFDVFVLEFFEGVVEVCVSIGDIFFGGEDFFEVFL